MINRSAYLTGAENGPPAGNGNPVYNRPSPYAAPPPGRPLARAASPDRLLFRAGLFIGFALLGYLLMQRLFIFFLTRFETLHAFYLSSPEAECLFNAAYTFFCVGLPFLIVRLMLRRMPELDSQTPLGGVYDGQRAILVIFAALGVCFAANIAANAFAVFMENVGLGLESYRQALEGDRTPDSAAGLLLYFAQGALIPAMIEEFAFRGVVMQTLRRFGDWFAVLVSALLFALMHGNLTQVPFALIAGAALGYTAVATGSLWPGICVHFLNNLFALVSTLATNRLNAAAASMLTSVCLYGFIAIGVLAAVFYGVRCPAWRRLRPGTAIPVKRNRFFLAPTVLIAIVLMTLITLSDIRSFSGLLPF